jgi:hypothetical protein
LVHYSERLLVILGGWMLNYPTELAVASIYRDQQRWPGILVGTRGGRRKGRALAQWLGVLRCGSHSGDQRGARVSHGDAVDR